MAKKRQSTPLPKAPGTRVVKQPIPPTRIDRLIGRDPNREMSHAERDAVAQRVIFMIIIGAVAVIALLLAIAFVTDGIIRPNQVVATVNGENISVADYQKRVRIERGIHIMLINDVLNDVVEENDVTVEEAGNFVLQQEPYASWWNELNTPDVMGLRVLDNMVDDRLVEAAAADLGVTVSDKDVDAYIDTLIGYDPEQVALIGSEPTGTPEPTMTPTPFVSPTPTTAPTATVEPTAIATVEGAAVVATATQTSTPAPTEAVPTRSADEVRTQFDNQKRSFISEVAGMANASEADVREVLRLRALRTAVGEALTASGANSEDDGATTLYADSRHILVKTEAEALDIIEALKAGESFAALAQAVSTDTGSGANGGELGWTPVAGFVEPFANAVRAAEIGEIIGPVESEFGFHIIQVRAKEEREAEKGQIDRANQLAFETWLMDVRTKAEGTYSTTNAWANNIPQSPLWRFVER